MIFAKHAGTAAKLLCLPILVAGLASCNRDSPPAASVSARNANATELMKEFRDNVDGVMNGPSMKPGSGQAGAPINVSPYVKSAPKHDMNDMHDTHDVPSPYDK